MLERFHKKSNHQMHVHMHNMQNTYILCMYVCIYGVYSNERVNFEFLAICVQSIIEHFGWCIGSRVLIKC